MKAPGLRPTAVVMPKPVFVGDTLFACFPVREKERDLWIRLTADDQRRALADTRKELQRPLPGELVLRVHGDAKERQHVLDVPLLEETHPGADLVGNPPARQLDLELQRLVVRAVEDGEVGELVATDDLEPLLVSVDEHRRSTRGP